MKPLGDFLSEQLVRALPAPAAEQSPGPTSTALAVPQDSVPAKDAEQLAKILEQYAVSGDFADSVNQAVPPPTPGESEDQFVHRAKEAIRKLLLAKFGS